ncbi:MAG: ArsB/NhaD family transporter [Candidatus Bipolaricaulia bacterium]
MSNASVWPVVVSLLIFAFTYLGIFLEKAHRAIIAIAGGAAMIVLGSWLSFYNAHDAVRAVDFDTITLLFGMMIVVGLFKETGFFQYLAIRAAKLTRGKPWLLLVTLGLVTSVLSMVLDNVTTIIIVVPVTISLADLLGIPALPFVMAEVLLSNIGGVATLIGDPPNILIGSAAGFSFLDFLTHLAPIVVVVWILSQGLLLLIFRKQLRERPKNVQRLLEMDARRAIVDRPTTRRMLVALAVTIVLFFLHDTIGLAPGLVALIGACIGLLWVRPNFEQVLKEVRWDVLLFFISLFVIVGGLEASGVIASMGHGVAFLADQGIYLAVIVVFWVGALASGVLSNVPFTIAFLPILKGLAVHGTPVAPLWWALALGVGFGANLTPLGSAANVLVLSLSDSIGERITFRRWLGSGTWVGLASCGAATILLLAALWLDLW